MSIFERIRSDYAYLSGALRTLKRTTPIGKHPDRTLVNLLESKVDEFGDRVALVSERETFTYRSLDARANRYARWALAQGIGKGKTVALLMPNRAEYLAIWYGLAKAGGATALINTNLTGQSLAHCINVVKASHVIVDATLADQLKAAERWLDDGVTIVAHGAGAYPRMDLDLDAQSDRRLEGAQRPKLTIEDPCLYIYTSGTTGLPKAANMNHYRVQLAMLGFTGVTNTRADDKIYDALPMYHSVGGILGAGVAFMVGGSCVIREKFSASEFWSDIVRHDCSVFVYIGELCRYLLNTPPGPFDRKHRVRLCFGNGLRPDVWDAFRDRFGIAEIREYYAATEGNCTIFNFDSKSGAVGRIPKWLERKFPIKIVRFDVEKEEPIRGADGLCEECDFDEAGELIGEIINDPSKPAARFEGYADKAATEKKIMRDVFRKGDTWFRTGDLLRKDKLGYYYFVDRIGDTFRWKGENVATNEVSERITAFHGVEESTIYGVAVPGKDGRAGMASLVLSDPYHFDLVAFAAFLREHLPDYARPLFLRIRDHLDVTGTFKQRKVDLVSEGFDPARVRDPLYFYDAAQGVFTPLDAALHHRIVSGGVRI